MICPICFRDTEKEYHQEWCAYKPRRKEDLTSEELFEKMGLKTNEKE